MSRLRVSRKGRILGSLTATVDAEWVLNGVGEMVFVLSTNDPKNIDEITTPGNEIYFNHDQLGEWGGIIADDERVWNAEDGTVTVRAFSAEALMDARESDETIKLKGTGGNLIRQLIDLTNNDEDTGLRAGVIQDERTERDEQLGDSLLTHAKRIASKTRANADFYVTPAIDADGRLTFNMNWLDSGKLDTGLILQEGKHFTKPRLNEQGPIVNRVRGLGDATSTGLRPVVVVEDAASRQKYGLRGRSYYYDGNKDLATVEENSRNTLAEMKDFRRYVTLSLLDVTSQGVDNVRDIWAMLRLRMAYKVMLTSVLYNLNRGGFGATGTLRLDGMKYFETARTVEIKGKLTEVQYV